MTLVFAVLGAGSIAMWRYWYAWDAESGQDRRARMYWWQYRFMGWPFRNALPSALPMGVGFLSAGVAILLRDLGGPGWMTSGLAGVTLVAMLLGAWTLIRPPRFLQPPWLLAAKTRAERGLPSAIPKPPEGARPVMTLRAFVLSAIGFTVFAVGWLALGLPASALLIGLAIGLPAILATRIRR